MRIILILPAIILFLSYGLVPAFADQMQINSDSIHLQTQQLTPLSTVVIQNVLPIVKRTRVLEDDSSDSLSITLSPTTLVFDPLTPTNPLLRNTTISIKGASSLLYSFATQPLQTTTQKVIPATSCDSGTCDDINPDVWKDQLTFGFGYNCLDIQGNNCSSFFLDQDNYIDIYQKNSYFTPVLKSTNNQLTKAQFIYKINIPASQQAGMYSTTIRYVLIPSL